MLHWPSSVPGNIARCLRRQILAVVLRTFASTRAMTDISDTSSQAVLSTSVPSPKQGETPQLHDTASKSLVDNDTVVDDVAGASSQPEPPSEPPSERNELPDPFQLDDPDDPVSDDDEPRSSVTELSLHPLDTLPLEPTVFTPAPPSPGKPQPLLPEDEVSDGTPTLYLPGLVAPGLFLPIPITDPLSTLLTKYVPETNRRPVRDVSGEWQRSDFHSLVMSNSWRALAKMARDRIVNASANDLEHILNLWYLRLSCLARLRLFNQTSAECTNLFAVLNNVEPPQNRNHLFDNVLPFELQIIHARIKYWAGDHFGYLDALSLLLKQCKIHAHISTDTVMWKERGTRVCLTIASQLVEMKDFSSAAKFLEPLCQDGQGSPTLRSAIARIYLQGGHLGAASQHFAAVSTDSTADESTKDMNCAIEAAAYGHWDKTIEACNKVLAADPGNALAANNLSVALLSTGKVMEGIEVFERILKESPLAVTTAEPWLFNLSTLYELRSSTAWDKKRELLIEVAKWSGDGLKSSCLKLPAV